MRRRKTQWFVWAKADRNERLRYWWSRGEWTRNPDESRPFSLEARLKTKVGAFRCARRCPAKEVRIICVYKNGTSHEWLLRQP